MLALIADQIEAGRVRMRDDGDAAARVERAFLARGIGQRDLLYRGGHAHTERGAGAGRPNHAALAVGARYLGQIAHEQHE